MSIGLDTSVVVRLLTGEPEDLARVALRFLNESQQAGDLLMVSDWVVAEAYYALQHHYGVSKTETLLALRKFLATSGIANTGDVGHVLQTPRLESAKPGFIDRVIHAHYRRSGAASVATFEKAAAKLPAVRVLTV